ncbi:NB-ARC domain-containing protein [Nocardia sp. NPDC004604]|uniref:NB-ARC domain-containing protein n=1 Tax=Nocardia sp. NPDC004604 TaxID=3157013 RepID=UPI0033A4A2B9
MPTPEWRRALVAIQSADGATYGAGFLITERHVLTCAHVIGDATGADAAADAVPTEPVLVEFTQVHGGERIEATVVAWSPVDDVHTGDIAVLLLASAPPAVPIRLLDSDSTALWGHSFRVYGFPEGHDEGLWATGVIRDRVGGGWYQLEDVKVPGSAIEGGFSGGAVCDDLADGVVGMVVARDRAAARKIGFMLPAALIAPVVVQFGVELGSARPAMGLLSNVPTLPTQFVVRSVVSEVLAALLAPTEDGARVAAVGMGGVGKSVLAAAVCRDERVRAAFPDGIVWVELGPNPVTPTRQAQVAAAFGQQGVVFADAQQGKALLTQLLAGRRCLLVVDNIWAAQDLGDLDVVEAPGRLLFTTRDTAIVRSVGATCFEVTGLSIRESLVLLARWARLAVEELPREALEIAAECGYLALALAMAGAMIAGRPERWPRVLRRLRQADLAKIAQPFGNYPYPDLLRAISVSVDALDPADRARYLELAVFNGRNPTVGAAQALWQHAGLDELDVAELLDRLADRSLIHLGSGGRFGMHDLQMDYVRHQVSELTHLHRRLLEAYREQAPGGWQHGPDDGYFYRNLPHHLAAAGAGEELRALLSHLAWLQTMLWATDATELIAAYRLLPQSDPVAVVGDALRLSSHALTRGRGQLPAQLVGRLGESDRPQVQELVAAACGWRGEPWLRPRAASLTAPGGPLLFMLVGHTSPIRDVVLTPDDRYALSGGWDGAVRVWDLADDGRERYVLQGHSGGVWKLGVSVDGRYAMSGSADGTIRVWDLADGSTRHVLRGHQAAVWSIALVPGSTLLVSASVDTTVRVWDWAVGREVGVLHGHTGIAYTVLAARGGRTIASKSEDGTLRIWDLGTGTQTWCFDSGQRGVQSRAMALTDRHALFAGDDGTVYCWDHRDGSVVWIDRDPGRGQVWSVAATPDGGHAVVGCASGEVLLLDLETGSPAVEVGLHSGWVEMVAVAPDGYHVLSGADDGILRLRDRRIGDESARTLRGHTGWIAAAAFSSDGTRVVSAANESTLRVWDVTVSPTQRGAPMHAAWIGAITAVADHTVAAAADDGSVSVWDMATGRRSTTVSMTATAVAVVEVANLGWMVLDQLGAAMVLPGEALGDTSNQADIGSEVRLYAMGEPVPGQVVRRAVACDAVRGAVALDGCLVVASTTAMRFFGPADSIWDLDPGAIDAQLAEPPRMLVVEAGRRHVVVGGIRGQVSVWDFTTRHQIQTYRGRGGPIISLATAVDQVLSGCVSGVLSAWRLGSPELVWEQQAHDSLLTGILIVGDRVVTGGGDGAIRLWRLTDGARIGVLAELGAPVRAIAALHGGRRIAVGAGDLLAVYDLESGIEVACFTGDGRITAIAPLPDGGVACGEAAGAVHILTLCEE